MMNSKAMDCAIVNSAAIDVAKRILDACGTASADHWIFKRSYARSGIESLFELQSDVLPSIFLDFMPRPSELAGRLAVVPWNVDGHFSGVDLIAENGEKYFVGEVGGLLVWRIPHVNVGAALPTLVCAGIDSAIAVSGCVDHQIIACRDISLLQQLILDISTRDKSTLQIVLAEIDGSSGEVASELVRTARSVGAAVATPLMLKDRPRGLVTFVDFCNADSPEFVEMSIMVAESKLADDSGSSSPRRIFIRPDDDWPELQEIVEVTPRRPYPVDALPIKIRNAVEEVRGFSQAPVALVATCALSAISLASQALVNVRRAEGLVGPVSLSAAIVAASGERKSLIERLLMQSIRDHESDQSGLAKKALAEYRQRIEALESRITGIKDGIRSRAKAGHPTAEFELALIDLEHSRESAPRFPRLLYDNVSIEALLHELSNRWPSGGLMSPEAGLIFGSHSLSGADSVMRTLAAFNQLWDGAAIHVDRRTSDSFVVRDARLTIGIQVQPEVFQSFIAKSGQLARGTGFLARFLICEPESTQGYRRFIEPPSDWPALSIFSERIGELLQAPVNIRSDGGLSPEVIDFSYSARRVWIDFYNEVETDLRIGGEYQDLRDAASKAAENCARIAALFQVFQSGVGDISEASLTAATRVTRWHLEEAKRFLSTCQVPRDKEDAITLEAWLVRSAKQTGSNVASKNDVRQRGPNVIRDAVRLDQAIQQLVSAGRAKLGSDGRRATIEVRGSLVV